MRLLFVTPFLPDRQATHGGGAYLASLLGAMAERAEIGLVAHLTPAEAERWNSPGHPWRWSAAAVAGHRPTGVASALHHARMLWRWRRLPLVAAKHWHRQIPLLLRQALAEWRPDAAFVEMAQMAQYLPCLRGTPTFFTDHEAGCPANTTTGLGAVGDRRDRRLWRRHICNLYPLADVVQAVTAEDAEALATLLGRPVTVRNPACEVPAQPVAPAQAPPRAVFVGDYRHRPNPEAARRLVREVLPLVRASAPDAELWFAGPECERLGDLGAVAGVRLLGFVPDLAELFGQVRLLLAPVWSGSGFRMKTLTALAHGVPVVTNALGARGCTAPPAACVRAETAADLAAAALAWLTSAEAAGRAGLRAHAWAREHIAPGVVAATQIDAVQALLATSPAPRHP